MRPLNPVMEADHSYGETSHLTRDATETAMTLNQLKNQYAKLCREIDAMGGSGDVDASRLSRLNTELDRIDRDLAIIRERAHSAPVLFDVVCVTPTRF